MPSLAIVAAQLAAAPKPVLCLDTCDILEIVQCLDWERPGVPRSVICIEAAQRLLNSLVANPNQALLIITHLVETEWNQNINEISQKAAAFLAKVDAMVERVRQAAGFAGTPLLAYSSLSATTLVADLQTLSTALLRQATRLDLDDNQVALALARVMNKRRPSHEGHIKDSINFEHYLAFARQLRKDGFTEEILFVSKNRKDYWDGDNPRIHPDLQPQLDDPAIRLRFFGSLSAALGYLRI